MSTRPTSSKSKTTAKKPAKSKAKPASAPKSRLAGPKPPKARAASSATKRISAASVAAARDSKTSTSKIPAPPPPTPVEAKTDVAASAVPVELKKTELIDLVVSRSDIKKKYAKPVVEAILEVLGETLARGREMNLQPFGKVKYNRTKETTSARVIVAKIRQSKPAKTRSSAPKSTVADAAE